MRRVMVGVVSLALLVAGRSAGSSDDDRASGDGGSGGTSAWPAAAAVQEENARDGDPDYLAGVTDDPDPGVEGFVDRTSIDPGDPLTLRVRSTRGAVTVDVYRLGWYDGDEARLIEHSDPVTTVEQPEPDYDATTRTVSAANWKPSLEFDTADWPPGFYALRLTAADGTARLTPVVVRAPSVEGAVVLLASSSNTQAYNTWGGRNVYGGPTGDVRERAYVVSYDRPIEYGAGAGELIGNEAPLVRLAERTDIPLAYLTSTDIDADPAVLDGAAAVISLGHDEYYSTRMRTALTDARDDGTNLAFLGANAIYRKIRFEPSPLGPGRLQVGYKNGDLDPILATDPDEATYEWRVGPRPNPESELTGVYYQCNPVKAPMVVADSSAWLFEGTGLRDGDALPDLVGAEYDQVTPSAPTPRPMQVLFHSPVSCRGAAQHADVAYYTADSGAGVFATGTSSWICGLEEDCNVLSQPDPRTQEVVTTMTTTLLTEFAKGPAGNQHPAQDNLDRLGINARTVTDLPAR